MSRFHFPILSATCSLSLLTLAMRGVSACDACGCHAPPELGQPATGLSVGVYEQYTDFSTLKDGGQKIDNSTSQWMHSTTTQAIIGYRINDDLAVGLFIPYISRSFKRPNNGVDEKGTVAGLGDISTLATLRILHGSDLDAPWNVNVQAGLKAPTGNTDQLKTELLGGGDEDPLNAVGGHDVALGTGSWDLIYGANAIGQVDRWYGSTQVTYTVHTKGDWQYQVANEISASGGLGYLVIQGKRTHVGVQANVIGESKGLDTVAGDDATDTGNHNLFVGPEVNALWNGQFTAVLGIDLPVMENNTDVQLVPTWRVRAAIGWQF